MYKLRMLASYILFLLIITSHSILMAQPSAGTVIQNQLIIDTAKDGMKTIPLPPGKWLVVFEQKVRGGRTGTGNFYIDTVLIEVESGVLKRTIFVRVNDSSESHNQYTDEPCKNTERLHSNNYGTQMWLQRCLQVTHLTKWLNNGQTPTVKAVRTFLITNRIEIPKTVVGSNYTEFDRNGRFLQVRVRFNPVAYGFADSNADWNSSMWHRDYINTDTTKMHFISRIIAYSEAYASSLNNSFNNAPSQFSLAFDHNLKKTDEEIFQTCTDIGFKENSTKHKNCLNELKSR
jgi:hypothetical protein